MMAPLLNPAAGDRPDLPRVRLDVRAGPNRSTSHDFAGEEFLIGGAPGCDYRLATPGVPAVVVQIARKPGEVSVRRITPATPVLLNGAPLAAGTNYLLQDGDALAVAGVAIAVQIQGLAQPEAAY